MDIQQLYDYCLSKKGVTEHFPFDEDTLVFKVMGKMFCLASLKEWEQGNPSINLKCDPDYALVLRDEFESVQPGYHSNKKHWNTVYVNREIPDKKVIHFINHSYELVAAKLPKKEREMLSNME
ncbi:MAG: MmcQ/YjbR family DNA-binding protein [Flavobacterium stagni]